MPAQVFDGDSEARRKRSFSSAIPSTRRIEMNFAKKAEKRSPLKRKPLRNPGESLQEEIHLIQTEQLIPPFIMAFFGVLIAALEWWRHFRELPPQPFVVSALAFVAIIYCTYKWVILRRRIRLLRLGMAGEKAVGQFLEALRSQGCRIFHDIVGKDFNIDHVVIGPRGVFTIETKTSSKILLGDLNLKGQRVAFDLSDLHLIRMLG